MVSKLDKDINSIEDWKGSKISYADMIELLSKFSLAAYDVFEGEDKDINDYTGAIRVLLGIYKKHWDYDGSGDVKRVAAEFMLSVEADIKNICSDFEYWEGGVEEAGERDIDESVIDADFLGALENIITYSRKASLDASIIKDRQDRQDKEGEQELYELRLRDAREHYDEIVKVLNEVGFDNAEDYVSFTDAGDSVYVSVMVDNDLDYKTRFSSHYNQTRGTGDMDRRASALIDRKLKDRVADDNVIYNSLSDYEIASDEVLNMIRDLDADLIASYNKV